MLKQQAMFTFGQACARAHERTWFLALFTRPTLSLPPAGSVMIFGSQRYPAIVISSIFQINPNFVLIKIEFILHGVTHTRFKYLS
jgi:hypothetical protein